MVYSILEDVCYSAVAYDYYTHCSAGLTVVLCVSESCCCGKLCSVLPSRRRIVVEGSPRCQLPQNCTPITAAGQDVLRGEGRGGEGRGGEGRGGEGRGGEGRGGEGRGHTL